MAPCQRTTDLLGPNQEFEHIRFICLPPYAPDKNPQELVWKFGKEAIANKTYASFKELTQTFENALNLSTNSHEFVLRRPS